MILNKEFVEVSEAVIRPMSVEELADMRRGQGARVIAHNGCYWEEIKRGFYQPVHLLARLTIEQAVPPAQFRWGFRAALCDDYASNANGAIPVHLLTNVGDYDTHHFSPNRRYHLRKCRKKVRIFAITKQEILREHGYEVISSSLKRANNKKVPTFDSYVRSLETINFNHHLVIVGLIDGKLGGYILGYAVNNTAYVYSLFLMTEALTTNISTGLTFDFVQVCRRSGKISEVVYGLHSRENFSLCKYKEGLGFPVNYIPAKVKMNLVIGKIIQWWWPHKYYRFTGRE